MKSDFDGSHENFGVFPVVTAVVATKLDNSY